MVLFKEKVDLSVFSLLQLVLKNAYAKLLEELKLLSSIRVRLPKNNYVTGAAKCFDVKFVSRVFFQKHEWYQSFLIARGFVLQRIFGHRFFNFLKMINYHIFFSAL